MKIFLVINCNREQFLKKETTEIIISYDFRNIKSRGWKSQLVIYIYQSFCKISFHFEFVSKHSYQDSSNLQACSASSSMNRMPNWHIWSKWLGLLAFLATLGWKEASNFTDWLSAGSHLLNSGDKQPQVTLKESIIGTSLIWWDRVTETVTTWGGLLCGTMRIWSRRKSM